MLPRRDNSFASKLLKQWRDFPLFSEKEKKIWMLYSNFVGDSDLFTFISSL